MQFLSRTLIELKSLLLEGLGTFASARSPQVAKVGENPQSQHPRLRLRQAQDKIGHWALGIGLLRQAQDKIGHWVERREIAMFLPTVVAIAIVETNSL